MNEIRISPFLLERYHIGEITHEEKYLVEEALAGDESLAAALAELDRADIDFRERFPMDKFFPTKENLQHSHSRPLSLRPPFKARSLVWGLCAAALVLVIALPLFILRSPGQEEFGERMKGVSTTGSSIELRVYLRGNTANEAIMLPDNTGVREGNTIQLVYRVFGANTVEKYGVIFSIDGRSHVTMHYPYTPWQSTLLVPGRVIPLDEAFILDDAPDYEIFFFVADDRPIDVRDVLTTARQLASQIEGNPNEASRLGTAVFDGFEVEVLTLLKE